MSAFWDQIGRSDPGVQPEPGDRGSPTVAGSSDLVLAAVGERQGALPRRGLPPALCWTCSTIKCWSAAGCCWQGLRLAGVRGRVAPADQGEMLVVESSDYSELMVVPAGVRSPPRSCWSADSCSRSKSHEGQLRRSARRRRGDAIGRRVRRAGRRPTVSGDLWVGATAWHTRC